MSINYYQIMGIKPDCPQQAIPHAFRTKAKQIHPDKNISSPNTGSDKQATILLLEAYRVLNNPQLRKQYDQNEKNKSKQSELQFNRYFQHSNISQREGRWFTECQQCMGTTQISNVDLVHLLDSDQQYYVKCWHCGLSLTLHIE